MSQFNRIIIHPEIVNGQPTIRGMRLTVRRVVAAAALYPNRGELLKEFPELDAEDVRQALEFTACNLDDHLLSLDAS